MNELVIDDELYSEMDDLLTELCDVTSPIHACRILAQLEMRVLIAWNEIDGDADRELTKLIFENATFRNGIEARMKYLNGVLASKKRRQREVMA